jgi:hypothetical protein
MYSHRKRFNSYKKRECERRRRYRIKKKTDHPCFSNYRCEGCKKYFSDLYFLFGFSLCIQCIVKSNTPDFTSFFEKMKLDVKNLTDSDKHHWASQIATITNKLYQNNEDDKTAKYQESQLRNCGNTSSVLFLQKQELAFVSSRQASELNFQRLYPETLQPLPDPWDYERQTSNHSFYSYIADRISFFRGY